MQKIDDTLMIDIWVFITINFISLLDNPWVVAQEFIDRENLSKGFLDQIAHFICQNTQNAYLGNTVNENPDPFTGNFFEILIKTSI